MSDRAGDFDFAEHRRQWLQNLRDEFVKLECVFPPPNFLPEEGLPKWVQNIEREVADKVYSTAKIKEEMSLTPRRLGAIIGHTCAYGVWLIDGLNQQFEAPALTEAAISKIPPEQLDKGAKVILDITEKWYPALRRLAKRALCSCVDQPYEDMTEFLNAYSQAFSRKPRTQGSGDIGNSATEVYFFMLIFWRAVNAMKSVHELHQCLVKFFGPHKAGDLKRIEKMCQRIELHYRKPGRPKRTK